MVVGSMPPVPKKKWGFVIVPTQQNRTGQSPTMSEIKFLELKQPADWFEGPYTETESE